MRSYAVRDEDGEVCGEVRRIHDAQRGWMWRSWAISGSDLHTDYRAVKLSLHDTVDEAEAEIDQYWGIRR